MPERADPVVMALTQTSELDYPIHTID